MSLTCDAPVYKPTASYSPSTRPSTPIDVPSPGLSPSSLPPPSPSEDGPSDSQVDAIAKRLSELSLTESALHHEARLVPDSPRLKFAFPPATLDDVPAPLHTTDPDSVSFSRFRSWLTNRVLMMRSLEPLGHRDLDRRRWALIQRMNERLESMSTTERLAWEREKILIGLYGFPDEQTTDGAKAYKTGKCRLRRLYSTPNDLTTI